MNVKRYVIFSLLLIVSSNLFGDDLGALGNVYGGMKTIVETVGSKDFWAGVGRSFGASPTGYVANFEVYNSSHMPVNAGLKGMASFMGAYFPTAKGMYNEHTIASILDYTGTSAPKASYMDQEYYFEFYISTKANPDDSPLYRQMFTQLGVQHDPKIYYYHTYTKRYLSEGEYVHGVGAEMIGYTDPSAHGGDKGNITISPQLSNLVLYNTSNVDMTATMKYGDDNLSVTLEKNSYNMIAVPLESTTSSSDATSSDDDDSTTQAPKFSLRPNTITFTTKESTPVTKQLKLPSEGFAGYTYVVEIFQDKGKNLNVGIQGLSPGHYDQAVTSRVRDITPCPAVFWFESVDQAGLKTSDGYFDLPGQVWVVYQGADSPVKSKVSVGEAVSWNLMRPLISQENQQVIFLYIETTSDKTAETFVDNFLSGVVGADVMKNYQDNLTKPFASGAVSNLGGSNLSLDSSSNASADKAVSQEQMTKDIATLMGNLTVSNDRMVDATTKTAGFLLGVDVFIPKGLGSGNYYYTLSPSLLNINSLVQLVASYVDMTKIVPASSNTSSSSTSASDQINSEVQGWLKDYIADPSTVSAKVESYLEQYGKSSILGSDGKLNQFGKYRLNAIVSGNVSLQYPPMKLSTVTNQYVFDFGKKKPDNLPTSLTDLSPAS